MSIETWKFINSFAPWFSAIGSLSAVVFALYIARQDKRVRLEVSVGHRLMVEPGSGGPTPSYLSIRVVNVGHREVQLSQLTWKAGIFKKSHAIQTISRNGISSPLPTRIKDGEEAHYLVSLDGEHDWIAAFVKDFLPNFPWLRLHFVRFNVHTTIGSTFTTKLEKGFRELCLEKTKP
ncbi:MAG: hypothetical protein ACJAW7_001604 [Candidatus Azotimanducaceae bacterium]|jgi:hypothetical protein